MNLPGSVHTRTGNVPLDIGGANLLHFEGRRDDGAFLIRLTRGTSGPQVPFSDVDGLLRYIEDMRELAPSVSAIGVADWLEIRLAEPARG